MAILVTGGAGYIGGHVVRELREAGEAVVVIDDLSAGSRSVVPPEVPLIAGDCGDQELVAAALDGHRISAVIDLAGAPSSPDVSDRRHAIRRIRDVIETAARHGVPHFIFSSTAEVYGDSAASALAEDAPAAPASARGRAALLGERMLPALASASGMRFVTLRLFDVAGADPRLRHGLGCGGSASLLRSAVQTALGAQPYVEIPGARRPTPDGTSVRDYVHVGDVARACVAALDYLRAGGRSTTLNCGSGRGYSALEVVGAVERASGQAVPVRYVTASRGDAAHRIADIARIRETLGWKPRIDGLDTLAGHVVAWEQEQRRRRQEASRAFSRMVAESGVTAARLQHLIAGFGPRPAARRQPTAPAQVSREQVAPSPAPSPTPPSGEARRLTIGMATHDDYDGVYFTLQALRLHQGEALDDAEFIVVDGNPTGPCATALKELEGWIPAYRYIPHDAASGITARDRIFQEACGAFVLCLDCHVLLAPGALSRLVAYLQGAPETGDLLQGPLVYDDLSSFSTHLRPAWREGAYGIPESDPAGADPDLPPFEIVMQRLGLFACRRTAWPGAHSRLRGAWDQEGYIHEKIRRRGGKVLCLPFLRWTSRFNRPLGATCCDHRWEDRVANHLIGFRELGWDTAPVIAHYQAFLGAPTWSEVARHLAARGLWSDSTELAAAAEPMC